MFTKELNVLKCNQRNCDTGITPERCSLGDALWVKGHQDALTKDSAMTILAAQTCLVPITIFLFVSTTYCCVAKWLFCIICNGLCAQKEMICASPTQMFDSTEDCEPFKKKKKCHVTVLDPCAATSFTLFCWNSRKDEWPSFFFLSPIVNSDITGMKRWYDMHEHTYVKSQIRMYCLSHTSLSLGTGISHLQRATLL